MLEAATTDNARAAATIQKMFKMQRPPNGTIPQDTAAVLRGGKVGKGALAKPSFELWKSVSRRKRKRASFE